MVTVAQYVRVVRSHVEVLRPHNFPVPVAAVWAGAAVAAGWPRLELALIGIAAVPLLVWAAGQLLNDFFDRDTDARSKPYLPIPRGDVRPAVALILAAVLDAAALASAAIIAPPSVRAVAMILVVTGILGTVLYSQALKASGLAGNIMMGAMIALVVLTGAAMTGTISIWVIAVAAACLFNHSAQNLVGAIRDVDGDRFSNVGTLAVRVGIRNAILTALAFQIGGLFFAIAPIASGVLPAAWLIAPVLMLPLMAYRYYRVIRYPTMENSVSLFKTGRIWSILFYGSFVLATVQDVLQLALIIGALAAMAGWALVFQELQREANVEEPT